MGAFQTYASEEWQATRQKKKEVYTKNPKGWSSSHSDCGATHAPGWGEGGNDDDPWGKYRWSQSSQDKGAKGWNKDDS